MQRLTLIQTVMLTRDFPTEALPICHFCAAKGGPIPDAPVIYEMTVAQNAPHYVCRTHAEVVITTRLPYMQQLLDGKLNV